MTIAILVSLVAAGPAQAQSLDALRASGAIGEKWDGYVVVRDAGAAGATAAAQKVNAERKKLYTKRAQADGATPAQVGQVYAKQIFNQVPKGTWFQQKNGQWKQK